MFLAMKRSYPLVISCIAPLLPHYRHWVSRYDLAARAGAWIAISLIFFNRGGWGQPVGTCAPWRPIVIKGHEGSKVGPTASKVMLTTRPGRLSPSFSMAP